MKNKFALCFRPVIYEGAEQINDTNGVFAENIIVYKRNRNDGRVRPLIRRSRLSNPSRNILSRGANTISVQSTLIGEEKKNKETNDLEKMETDHKRKVITSDREHKLIIHTRPCKSPSSSSPGQILQDFQSIRGSRCDLSYDQNKKTRTNTNDKASDSSLLSSNLEGDQHVVLYWIVLALFVTMVCGKVFSVVLVTLWLYYIRRRPSNYLGRPASDAPRKLLSNFPRQQF